MTATTKSTDGKSCCGSKSDLPSKPEAAAAAPSPVSPIPSQEPVGPAGEGGGYCCKTGG